METTEIRDVLSTLHDKISRYEVQQQINTQLQPLLTSVSALEKTISITNQTSSSASHELQEQLRSVKHTQERIENSSLLQYSVDSLQALVRDHVRDHYQLHQQDLMNNPSIKSLMDHAIAKNNDYVLRQLQTTQETIRLEVNASSRHEMELEKNYLHSTLQAFEGSVQAHEEKYAKLKKAIKELSSNVAKSLSKKMDSKEFSRAFWREYEEGAGKRASKSKSKSEKDEGSGSNEFDQLISSLKSQAHHETEEDEEEKGQFYPEEEQKERSGGTKKRSQSVPRSRTVATGRTSPAVTTTASSIALQQQVLMLQNDVNQVKTLLQQIQKEVQQASQRATGGVSTSNQSFKETLQHNDLERFDWRIALGEMAMNIRSELVEKCTREEMYSAMRSNSQDVIKRLKECEDQLITTQSKSQDQVTSLQNEIHQVKNKISGELTGAR